MNEPRDATVAATLGDQRLARSLLALLAPFVALVVEKLLWGLIQPHVWFLFYPAVFVSAALGGRRIGLLATALSTLLVWWFFLRSDDLFTIEPRHFFAVGVFFVTGSAFAFFHDRLTHAVAAESAKKQLELDLREMSKLHEKLHEVAKERRVFAALIENSSDFIGIADAAGKPIYVNPAGRRLVGLSPDQRVEDTQIPQYYPESQRSFAADVIVKSVLEKGQWQGETYFRNWQTEQAIPVSDQHFMIRDPETEEVLGMATITRDISDLRKAQDDLRRTNDELAEAREFLESVFESATQYSIIAKDLKRHILAWNRGAQRIYGYAPNEVIGRSSDMLHVSEELDSGTVAELHQRALRRGHATTLFRRRRKDGTEFLARTVITRRNDARGNAIGYVVVSHDVTAEQRHVREQQFLAEVGETVQASLDFTETVERVTRLVVVFLGDGCAVDVVRGSDQVRRMRVVHADSDKAVLAHALQLILPDRNHPLWKVVETGQPLLFPEVTRDFLRLVAKNEDHQRLLLSLGVHSAMLVPLVARARLIAVLTIVSCRADRRYTKHDLRLAEELARRAAMALDNADLYEVAQQAIQAREHVLGVVAHDLRNPLGNILMQSALLQRRDGPERRSPKPLEAIERAATRMNRLIQDLLDVNRMEAGRLAIEPARVPSASAVTECVEAQRALAASASLELQLDLPEGLPDLWVDRDRLLQVFENLIGNAVKFTEPGGCVAIGADSRTDEVLFWVTDTGAGIASDDVPHLFDRFWQAQGGGRHGSGLGLPIAKGIVEAHGGRIWAESKLRRGSTFFFTIPTAAAAASWRAKAAPSS